MFIIGLTGSIGMGKSQTAALFEAEGVPRYDADAAVHALYEKGGAAVAPIGELVPEAISGGAVDRAILGQIVLQDAEKLKQLEAIVHPLAGLAQMDFLMQNEAAGKRVVVLDIPLLLENGGEAYVDSVVVVSAPLALQRERVLARPGMNEARFEAILAKQMPDAEKRKKAEFIVDSSISVEDAHRQIRAIMKAIDGRAGTALAARKAAFQKAGND